MDEKNIDGGWMNKKKWMRDEWKEDELNEDGWRWMTEDG